MNSLVHPLHQIYGFFIFLLQTFQEIWLCTEMETGDSSLRSTEKKTFPFLQSLSPQFVFYPALTLPSLWPACSLPLSLFSRAGERHSTRPRSVWLDHLFPLAEVAQGFVCYLLSRFHHGLWNKTETRQRWKGGGQMAAGVRPGADRWWLKGSPQMQSHAPSPFWSNITQIFLLFFLLPINPTCPLPSSFTSSTTTLLRNTRICRSHKGSKERKRTAAASSWQIYFLCENNQWIIRCRKILNHTTCCGA